jgi:hypothetical protein
LTDTVGYPNRAATPQIKTKMLRSIAARINVTLRESRRGWVFGCAYNGAVQRPRDHVSSAARVHNEMTHMRRARADLSRSAATAC